jgi:hypothetical protein
MLQKPFLSEKQKMELTLRQLTSRILSISHTLDFDRFISKERRERLEAELSSLIAKRNNLLEIMSKLKV